MTPLLEEPDRAERLDEVEWFLRGLLTGVAGTCVVIAIITVTIIGNVR